MSMSVVGKNYGILNFLLLCLVGASYFPVPVVGFSRIRILGVDSIDIVNFGHETGHETGPSSGPRSVLGHYKFRCV